MVDRFLRYSLQHSRKILLMIQDEKGMRRLNATITRIGENAVFYVTARSRREKELPLQSILAADYARGDDGDTLARENAQNMPNPKM